MRIGMERGAVVVEIASSAARFSASVSRSAESQGLGAAAVASGGRGRVVYGGERRRDVADQLEVGLAGCRGARFGSTSR